MANALQSHRTEFKTLFPGVPSLAALAGLFNGLRRRAEDAEQRLADEVAKHERETAARDARHKRELDARDAKHASDMAAVLSIVEGLHGDVADRNGTVHRLESSLAQKDTVIGEQTVTIAQLTAMNAESLLTIGMLESDGLAQRAVAASDLAAANAALEEEKACGAAKDEKIADLEHLVAVQDAAKAEDAVALAVRAATIKDQADVIDSLTTNLRTANGTNLVLRTTVVGMEERMQGLEVVIGDLRTELRVEVAEREAVISNQDEVLESRNNMVRELCEAVAAKDGALVDALAAGDAKDELLLAQSVTIAEDKEAMDVLRADTAALVLRVIVFVFRPFAPR